MKKHYSFLAKIEEEFSEEINGQNILPVTYKDKKGEERKMYELDFEQSVQILMIESEFEEEIRDQKILASQYTYFTVSSFELILVLRGRLKIKPSKFFATFTFHNFMKRSLYKSH